MIQYAERLAGVHADLCRVVTRAAEILADRQVPIKLRAHEGLRTTERQAQLVAAGASKTLDSRHITGHAVDLLPVVDIDKDGKVETEELYNWQLSYDVARAMKKAAAELNIPVVWGGVWDRQLASLPDPEMASADYVARRRKKNLRAFVDGPHFELDRARYPA